jgi:periplasmic divalent cation tolerance protein
VSEAATAPEVCVVFVTAPDAACAERIARALVEERLAACVNRVSGLRSLYHWEGELQDDSEVLLIAKTRRDRVADLAKRVSALHPYALPEVIALPVVGGSDAYLDWVRSESTA